MISLWQLPKSVSASLLKDVLVTRQQQRLGRLLVRLLVDGGGAVWVDGEALVALHVRGERQPQVDGHRRDGDALRRRGRYVDGRPVESELPEACVKRGQG